MWETYFKYHEKKKTLEKKKHDKNKKQTVERRHEPVCFG